MQAKLKEASSSLGWTKYLLVKQLLLILEKIGDYTRLVAEVFWLFFTSPPSWSLIRDQLYLIGVTSLPVVAITGFSTGLVLAAQSFFQLSDKGLTEATGIMVAKAMMTELGPILTAFMITGRVGASMCAELGSMKVTEQVDALRSLSVNPRQHLVAPRMIAGLSMAPLLTAFSNFMGLLGAYLVAVCVFHMSHSSFLDPIPVHLTRYDLFSGLIKSIFFALLIISISCYKGLNTQGGAAGVGKATTESVVTCYSLILISNFLLTLALNLLYSYLFL